MCLSLAQLLLADEFTVDGLNLSGDQQPFYVELDEVEDGQEQQNYLAQKTGQRTVPSVLYVSLCLALRWLDLADTVAVSARSTSVGIRICRL